MHILEEFEHRNKPDRRRAVMLLAAFAPVSWILFLLCSPLFLAIWDNKIRTGLPTAPFVFAFSLLLTVAAIIMLQKFKSLNWKTALWLTGGFIVSTAGMIFIFLMIAD